MEANGVNYYKGVLLCSRPNESPSVNKEKPFCARVVPPNQIGLVPTKHYDEHKTLKRKLPVLNNHKKWLQQFKKKLQQNKQQKEKEEEKKQELIEKIKRQGRQRVKENHTSGLSPEKSAQNAPNPVSKTESTNPHRKKAKPAWAQTEVEAEHNQETQVDQLLDFFQKGETEELKDYVSDEDIKKVLSDLKEKIEHLKEQGEEWKHQKISKMNEESGSRQERADSQSKDDDILSRISRNSGAQSVSSQKTAERVEELERKKNERRWEAVSAASSKEHSSKASVDEQIAKHIADEILRNYPNLKHHSNQSIRKLLEKQARQELKAQ